MIKKSVFILVLIGTLMVIAGIIYWIFGGIEVKLVGENEINVTYKSDYNDEGFKITKYDNEVSEKRYRYETKSNVDTNILGEYETVYYIKYFLKTYELKRIVHVVDNVEPEITTNIESIEKDYCTKKVLSKDLEYNAIDNYDGDVTDKVTKEENEEGVILTVTDNNGNVGTKNILYTYTEKPKDKFTLNGSSTMYVAKGSKFSDPGTTYKDGCGVKMDVKVSTSGSVDTSKNGDYKITYTANDLTVTRKVTVYTPSTNTGLMMDLEAIRKEF